MTSLAKSLRDSTVRTGCVIAATLLHVLGSAASPVTGEQPISLRTDVSFSDHVHRHFNVRAGLPSNHIYDAVQTRNGYVWIATSNGLARFDGLRFRTYRRLNTPSLPANDTRVLCETRDGHLWIGTIGGLCRYRPGRPGAFEDFDRFAGQSIHAIMEDADGNLWIGTREETWRKGPATDFVRARDAPTVVRSICQDEAGRLWFGSAHGLFVRQDDSLQQVEQARLKALCTGATGSPFSVTALRPDRGGVWVGATHGLIHVGDQDAPIDDGDVGQTYVGDVIRTRDGSVYAATARGLCRVTRGGAFALLPTETRANCLLEDTEGGLWVGHTVDRGLHYYRNSIVRRLLTDERVNCVYEDLAGDLWFGCFSGLHRLRNGELSRYDVADGLPHDNVQSIALRDHETLWIGTRRGLAHWSDSQITAVTEPEILAEANIEKVFVDSSDALWLAFAGGGGCTFRNGVVERIAELENGNIGWFHEAERGIVWIGHEFGLFRMSDGHLRPVNDPAFRQLNNRHFLCCFAEPDGTLWLGTGGGIVRYQQGRFDAVTSADGLAADYVDRIHADAHDNLWFAGRDGVFHVSLVDLHAAASGHSSPLSCRRLEPIEGVTISHCHPKAWRTRDGAMWMAARRGAICVPPTPWTESKPPPVLIDRLQVDGRVLAAENLFEYTSGRHRLAIDFATPAFSHQQAVRAKYRLLGSDADWIEAGEDRVAYYTDLAPGNYQFQVMAGQGGAWNEGGDVIDIRVQPRWWERTVVRVALGVGILNLGLLYAQIRTRRLRRRNAVLRREIAHRKEAEEASRRHQAQLARVSRAASLGEMATSIAHEIKQPLFAMMTDAKTALLLLRAERPDLQQLEETLQGIHLGGNRATEIVEHIRALVRR
ncbi:MAG: two-component regulator propeller domain-containing protein, partial [Planctomycetota bacterium]